MTLCLSKNWRGAVRHAFLWSCLLFSITGSGCRTTPKMAAVDIQHDPRWRIREGQVVWKTERAAPGLAGEVLVATHPSGESLVQFTKTPLPFILARTQSNHWQISFLPQKRTLSGSGSPPTRWLWLHLAPALAGTPSIPPLELKTSADGSWTLENRETGASLTGYLTP